MIIPSDKLLFKRLDKLIPEIEFYYDRLDAETDQGKDTEEVEGILDKKEKEYYQALLALEATGVEIVGEYYTYCHRTSIDVGLDGKLKYTLE